jgi:hypothetical protein
MVEEHGQQKYLDPSGYGQRYLVPSGCEYIETGSSGRN